MYEQDRVCTFDVAAFHRVTEHAAEVDKECELAGVERVMTLLYGSQNYNTHFPDSDVDTKSIVIPKFHGLIFDPPVNRTLILPNGEHAEIKDIRLMFNQYRKQNINFIETLYTTYANINPRYDELYRILFYDKERIAHYNPRAMVMSVCGEMIGKYHRYFENGLVEYSNKQLSNMIRMRRYVELYLKGENVETCLVIPEGPESAMHRDLKRNMSGLTVEEKVAMATELYVWASNMMEYARAEMKNESDEHVNAWLDEIVYSTFVEFCDKE